MKNVLFIFIRSSFKMKRVEFLWILHKDPLTHLLFLIDSHLLNGCHFIHSDDRCQLFNLRALKKPSLSLDDADFKRGFLRNLNFELPSAFFPCKMNSIRRWK